MKPILVETSARHIHLNKADMEKLCGPNYELPFKRMLSQPGQFVSDLRLDVIGPKSTIKSVVVLGPLRSATQVEVSATDARALGVNPPIRESGDIKGSTPITLKGPVGEIVIPEGVILAKRHIHMHPDDAKFYGVKDKQVVAVKVKSNDRSLIFGDVLIRVREDFGLTMHIDTDEANAAGLSGEVYGELITNL
ncbi:MAG TPA: phosphate propanoyltransferase [Bacilli bacterium]|nr:phosphate propanoyltransferase [Bacilli bacterium]